MKDKFRLHRRKSGVFSAHDRVTGARHSLGTKVRAEAIKLLQAKNEAYHQPGLSRELAKAYMQNQDAQFGVRTWADVASFIDRSYEGSTKHRFQKFVRSAAVCQLMALKLVETSSAHFLQVLTHPKAGVSTNVQLRILHNRALDLEWILRPVLSKKAWPKIRYKQRKAISRQQHEAIMAVTNHSEYRAFFELLWQTGGSQSDIASLQAEDINWRTRRLFYSRLKLKARSMGNACLVIGESLEIISYMPNAEKAA